MFYQARLQSPAAPNHESARLVPISTNVTIKLNFARIEKSGREVLRADPQNQLFPGKTSRAALDRSQHT